MNENEVVTRGILRVELRKELKKELKKELNKELGPIKKDITMLKDDVSILKVEIKDIRKEITNLKIEMEQSMARHFGLIKDFISDIFQATKESVADLPSKVITLEEKAEENENEHRDFRVRLGLMMK